MGRMRTNNEDAFVAQRIWNNNFLLAVAIDGVGGYEGGEVAARIAQESIVEFLTSHRHGEYIDLIKQAVVYANNIIVDERNKDPERANMSCVLSAALFDKTKHTMYMAHVGDTRLYMYCNGQLEKLSHDHSLVGYREEIGDLTEEQAMHHPQRNLISRSVGMEHMEPSTDMVETGTFMIPRTNCSFLLCSDGLTDLVTSRQIIDILEHDTSEDRKLQMLIDAANAAGGKDNITAVLVTFSNNEAISDEAPAQAEYESQPPKPQETQHQGYSQVTVEPVTTAPARKQRNKLTMPLLLVVVALLASVAVNYFAISSNKEQGQELDSLKRRMQLEASRHSENERRLAAVEEIVANAGDKDSTATKIREGVLYIFRDIAPDKPQPTEATTPQESKENPEDKAPEQQQ